MYLFGSLANGDFDKDSDIDVLIVTKDEVSEDTFLTISMMHEKLSEINSPLAVQLEVSYIPQKALRRYDPPNNKHPHLERGKGEQLRIMQHNSDWIIQRYILRERGITIMGPDPRSLIDLVSPDDLKWAVKDILNGWIKGFLDEAHILESRGYQSYTVLTICRILHTQEYGTIVSKPVASDWAKVNLDKRWNPLIERAWEGRQIPGTRSNPMEVQETLDFIRYALKRMRTSQIKK